MVKVEASVEDMDDDEKENQRRKVEQEGGAA